ncbi:MAG: carbohydrate ABC transporter permease [Clostridiales bacterium]|jgi:putative aldouronate transport system permease protein|nr:carbohydrate ABC transporter permease [Clostridiales bacterium]
MNPEKEYARMGKRSITNSVSLPAEVIIHIITAAFVICCILPFIFIIIISFTEESSLSSIGYSFFPQAWSAEAYDSLFKVGRPLWLSFFNSIVITVIGTGLSVLVCIMYSYGMFRRDYPYRKFFTFIAFFTMMFGGGLAPTVMVCRALGLNNNYAALIIPALVSPFNFIVMRTFFKTSISESLIESAALDGSGEFNTLFKIVVPIAKPGIATIALLNALAYWNDWYLALLYVDVRDMYPLQYFLMQMQNNIEFLKRNAAIMGGGVAMEALAEMPSESLRMALCVFIVVPIAFAYPFFQRYIVAGLTIGAVKE